MEEQLNIYFSLIRNFADAADSYRRLARLSAQMEDIYSVRNHVNQAIRFENEIHKAQKQINIIRGIPS